AGEVRERPERTGKHLLPYSRRTPASAGGDGRAARAGSLRGLRLRLRLALRCTRPGRLRLPARVRHRRVGGREPRDRDAVRGAGHVVEPGAVAEVDALRVATVLAADPDLQSLADRTAAGHGHLDERADAVL